MKKRISRRSFLKAGAVAGSVAVGAAVLGGCSSSAQQTGGAASSSAASSAGSAAASSAAAAEDGVIRIGVIGPMTGGSAIYGEGAQNAVDMAVEELNSSGGPYSIEIVNGGQIADDAQDARQAMNAYNLVMADGPEALVGSFFSTVTLPIAQQAAVDDMLLVATGATNVDVTIDRPTVFRDCFIDPYQGKMAALFVQSQGYGSVAVLYANDDDYSNGLKDAFIENCEASGITVVYEGQCTTTDTDFSSQVSQVAASGAECLYYPCFQDTVPLLVSQARSAGFTGAIMGGDGWDSSDTTGLESQFENCYFTNHYSSEDTSEAVVNFVTKYTELYGTESLNACASLYYDAIYMIYQAAQEGGGTDTASLVEGMTGMTFTGVGGTFTLDENGDPAKQIVFNTFVDGQVQWFETLGPDGEVVASREG